MILDRIVFLWFVLIFLKKLLDNDYFNFRRGIVFVLIGWRYVVEKVFYNGLCFVNGIGINLILICMILKILVCVFFVGYV